MIFVFALACLMEKLHGLVVVSSIVLAHTYMNLHICGMDKDSAPGPLFSLGFLSGINICSRVISRISVFLFLLNVYMS